jgi:hypothetical protein
MFGRATWRGGACGLLLSKSPHRGYPERDARDKMPSATTCDAARRLRGEVVSMIVPSENKGIFNKLFGRKADTTIQ